MNYLNLEHQVDMSLSVVGEHITTRTLIGVSTIKRYPYSHGNCFSMRCDNGCEYRIVNFYFENLEEAIKRGVNLPVRVLPISDHHAIIADARIELSWYSSTFCTSCCPSYLLPLPQRLANQLRIDSGLMAHKYCDDGFVITQMSSYENRIDLRTQDEKHEDKCIAAERLRRVTVLKEQDIRSVCGIDISSIMDKIEYENTNQNI